MDCYSIPNPKYGQKCNDTQLGRMVYSKEWGGWVKTDYEQTEDGGLFSSFDNLAGGSYRLPEYRSIIDKYGMYIIGACVFIIAILFMGKKGK